MMHVAQSPLKCKLNHSLYEPDWQRLQTTVLPLGPIYSWTLWKEQGGAGRKRRRRNGVNASVPQTEFLDLLLLHYLQ